MEKESAQEIAQLEKSGAGHIAHIIKWTMQFSNRFESALSDAKAERQGNIVAVRTQLIADLPEWGVDWARFASFFTRNLDAAMAQNLHKLAEAIHTYHTKHPEQPLPPHARFGPDGKPLLSWRVMILPYLDENELFRQFHLNEPWDSPHNKTLLNKMPKVFESPPDPSRNPTATYYQVIVGKGTLFEGTAGLPVQEIPKGCEKTLLIVEGPEAVPWTKPQDLEYDPGGPLPKLGGLSREGFWAVFFNGETRFIKNSIDQKTLRALISRAESGQVDLNKLP